MPAIASMPRSVREPWAARPRVSSSAQTKPLCATQARRPRRLRHDAGVGAEAPQHGLHAFAGVLLVGDRGDDHVAAQPSCDRRGAASMQAATPPFMS